MNDIINFGSINIDYTYKVVSLAREGETVSTLDRNLFYGGKGLNQSIAAARAGGRVYHAGLIGNGGEDIIQYLASAGVDVTHVGRTNVDQGHAIIQVDQNGRNCIIVYPGSNRRLEREYIDHVLGCFPSGGLLVLQNEISNVSYIISQAQKSGFQVVFNASPIDSDLAEIPIEKLTWLMINEIEGQALSGKHTPNEILQFLHEKYPQVGIVLTLGEDGVLCRWKDTSLSFGVYRTEVVDTTAAGDTFTGYFVACLANGAPLETALKLATAASAMAISRLGASSSIPHMRDVLSMLAANSTVYTECSLEKCRSGIPEKR